MIPVSTDRSLDFKEKHFSVHSLGIGGKFQEETRLAGDNPRKIKERIRVGDGGQSVQGEWG
ncbi:hypothetical protein Brsp01_47600 [Brucella sp. NBRC 12950]|nr:hypothetical protein Brsp01_47600 [Brucella sp. NBRC 12950]